MKVRRVLILVVVLTTLIGGLAAAATLRRSPPIESADREVRSSVTAEPVESAASTPHAVLSELIAAPEGRWTGIAGTAVLGGQEIQFAASRQAPYYPYYLRFAGHVSLRDLTGIQGHYDPRKRSAKVSEAPPAEDARAKQRELESPTNHGALNNALVPAIWLRGMIAKHATGVEVLGDEVVAGRAAQHVRITLHPEVASKYGGKPWEWWIDRETGVLTKYVLPGAGGPPTELAITALVVNGREALPSLVIPRGTRVSVGIVGQGLEEIIAPDDLTPAEALARARH